MPSQNHVSESLEMDKSATGHQRVLSIDYMRGFIFLLMAVDHALHAYAANWGKYAFFRDYDRSYVFDSLYLFNQAAIMPVLFFTFGAYCLPKLQAHGFKKFWKEHVVKFVIPFCVGIPLIVPLLTFPKYAEFTDSSITFVEFFQTIFFPGKLQAGPFWVMYALVLYTGIFLVIHKLFPKFIDSLGHFVHSAFQKPLRFFIKFGVFSALVYGISDLRYGAPWWVGFRDILPDFMYGQLFSLQGSKYIMNFVYFVMGAAFMHSKVWSPDTEQKNWTFFLQKRFYWLIVTAVLGVAYCSYAHVFFHEGAFDYSLFRIIVLGQGSLSAYQEALALLPEKAPLILVRTTLLAFLAMFQVVTLLAFFSYKTSQKISDNVIWTRIWSSAALCCWGIFIIHDPLMIWIQYGLVNMDIHIVVKFMIVTVGGLIPAWLITKALLRVPYIKRVFELY